MRLLTSMANLLSNLAHRWQERDPDIFWESLAALRRENEALTRKNAEMVDAIEAYLLFVERKAPDIVMEVTQAEQEAYAALQERFRDIFKEAKP